jgi:hypothetical protein
MSLPPSTDGRERHLGIGNTTHLHRTIPVFSMAFLKTELGLQIAFIQETGIASV